MNSVKLTSGVSYAMKVQTCRMLDARDCKERLIDMGKTSHLPRFV